MSESPTSLQALAQRYGLGEAYHDHRGELKYFSDASRWAVLKAMGLNAQVELVTPAQAGVQEEQMDSRLRGNDESRCHCPAFLATEKPWGLSIQLYTLRSSRNWGIGDFADLRELIELAAPLGCDVIGLNPLHALFPAAPMLCSPYSPSSRLFLNILYIAIDEIPERADCAPLNELSNQASFQSALAGVRATDLVMYEQVATLKLCALRLLHAHFVDPTSNVSVERTQAFQSFVEQGGEALRLHALFDALDAHFRPQSLHGWHQWPAQFHDPRGAAATEFAAQYADQVSFFLYAQWLAHEQLRGVQRHAVERGMRIGLYGDLAVGANPDGAEVWTNQALYVQDASVGAPPDALALGGQDWGVPPMNPSALQSRALQPMRDLLRASMQCTGALRIDHVMSLFRLWWVPRGMSAVEGVYVHYPLDALMQAVAEASQAARCLVIGEDLGTVPDEVRNAMAQYSLLHYKVLVFEKQDGRFKTPDEYLRDALATATTHDLPPLRAWWEELDLTLRERLQLYPNGDIAAQLREERHADRHALLRALRDAGLWQWQDSEPLPEFSFALARAIHLYLGQTQAALVLVQLEDLIGMTDPVNVPGTHTEHANWQRKLTASASDIFVRDEVRELLSELLRQRARNNSEVSRFG